MTNLNHEMHDSDDDIDKDKRMDYYHMVKAVI